MAEVHRRPPQPLTVIVDEATAQKAVDAITQIVATSYEKSAAYTNLIIFAGYAGFFAVWGQMSEFMTHKEMLISAVSISFSLVVFVGWEVWKMFKTTGDLNRLNAALQSNPSASKTLTAMQQAQRADEASKVKLYRYWYVILILTITPGLIGGGTLLYSFVRQLFSAI